MVQNIDDVATCSRVTLTRLDTLTSRPKGFGLGTALWSYLRMKHYARHSAMVTASELARHQDDRQEECGPLWDALHGTVSPLDRALKLEQNLKDRGFFNPSWVSRHICDQMIERDVTAHIESLLELAKSKPLTNPFMEADEEAMVREVVRMRNEYRAICAEVEDTFDDRTSIALRGSLNRINAGRFRALDSGLADLVRTHGFPRRLGKDLVQRFYSSSMDCIENSEDAHEFVGEHGLGGKILNSRDLPWLSSQLDDSQPASEWWV